MGATSLRANFRSCRILQVMDGGTAIGFGLPAAEAWRYLCVAGTKRITPRRSRNACGRKVSVKLNNPAGIYELGDEVGAMERWFPPAVYGGMDHVMMRAVFDALAAQPHAKSKVATAIPWAGKPLINAGRTDGQAMKILADWLQSELLIPANRSRVGAAIRSRH